MKLPTRIGNMLRRSGLSIVTICGGEPTLWRRLPELLQRATGTHQLAVHMNTNAIKLRNRDFAQSLRAAGLTSIMVSLHATDPVLSDTMTRSPGTHGRKRSSAGTT